MCHPDAEHTRMSQFSGKRKTLQRGVCACHKPPYLIDTAWLPGTIAAGTGVIVIACMRATLVATKRAQNHLDGT